MVLSLVTFNRSNRPEVFCKKGVLKISQNSRENTCEKKKRLFQKRDSEAGVFLLISRNF